MQITVIDSVHAVWMSWNTTLYTTNMCSYYVIQKCIKKPMTKPVDEKKHFLLYSTENNHFISCLLSYNPKF